MGCDVAALYVDSERGPYGSISGVDVWGVDRDARLYEGPHPVVAHPPCGPWGRFSWRARQGDRDCAPRAVEQVRRWGGVLEHPRASRLWPHMQLPRPGWLPDKWGGWTLEIEQVRWGHPCVKPTWLYIVGCLDLPAIPPARQPTHRIADGGDESLPYLATADRHLTPPELAMWLVEVARRCRRGP